MINLALEAVHKLQQGPEKEKKSTVCLEPITAASLTSDTVAAAKPVIINTRLHCEAFEALSAVKSNRFVWDHVDSGYVSSDALFLIIPIF